MLDQRTHQESREKRFVKSLIVVIVVLVAALAVGLRLAGLSPYVILSGSMEPTYPVGSLVYVAPVDANALQKGQVITFAADENTVVTHRVVEVEKFDAESGSVDLSEGIWFRTQGDANSSPDINLVNSKNVIGTPVFCVPFLGYISNFLHSLLPF